MNFLVNFGSNYQYNFFLVYSFTYWAGLVKALQIKSAILSNVGSVFALPSTASEAYNTKLECVNQRWLCFLQVQNALLYPIASQQILDLCPIWQTCSDDIRSLRI